MRRSANPARPRLLRWTVWALCTSVLLSVTVDTVSARAATAAPGTTAISLSDDDGGAPLFSSSGLRPGWTGIRCVAVHTTGSTGPSSEVRLTAQVTRAELAPYLMLTVERGQVHDASGCPAFSGEVIWRGTLADMPISPAGGIDTGWHPGTLDRVVFRFTVSVLDDPRAQRLAASASFVWTLADAGLTPDRPASPPVTPSPALAPPVDAPSDGQTSAGPRAPDDSSTVDVAPAVPPAGSRPADPAPSGGSIVSAPPLLAEPSIGVKVVDTVVAIVHNGAFPLVLVAVLVAFLFLQDALDRRDPKLALAPARQATLEFRDFLDAPTTEMT